jgi:hypothetical protein
MLSFTWLGMEHMMVVREQNERVRLPVRPGKVA